MTSFISGFLVSVVIGIIWFNVGLEHCSTVIKNWLTVSVGCVLLAFIIYQGVKSLWIYIKLAHRKYTYKTDQRDGYCLLIVGEWGSGKTTLYEDVFKNKKHIDDIHISCFSANKAELISQLGQESFLWKLCSLNGILSKLLENNWRKFMPTRRVVVFDDLERLHSGEHNYVDLIGVIDYLKVENKCDIILLASCSNIKYNVFTMYMERIVDEICTPIIKDVRSTCQGSERKQFLSADYKQFDSYMGYNQKAKTKSEFINQIVNDAYDQIYAYYTMGKFTNIRVISKSLNQIKDDIQNIINENKIHDNSNEQIGIIILKSLLANEVKNIVKVYHLLYQNYRLFSEMLEYRDNQYHNIKYRDNPPKNNTDMKKYAIVLTNALSEYHLYPEYFNCGQEVNLNNFFKHKLELIACRGVFERYAFEHLGETIMMMVKDEFRLSQSPEVKLIEKHLGADIGYPNATLPLDTTGVVCFLDDVFSDHEPSSDKYEWFKSKQYAIFYERVHSVRTYIMDTDRVNRLAEYLNKTWKYGILINDYYNGLSLLIIAYKYDLKPLKNLLIDKLKVTLSCDPDKSKDMGIDNLLSANYHVLKRFSLWFLDKETPIKITREVMKNILTQIKTDLGITAWFKNRGF